MAATSVGQIGLDLVVNQNQFQKQMSGITGLAKKAGAALAAAFAVKKVVSFGKECLQLGSDLAEVQNVVDVTFPHMTAQVDEFAKSAASSFGLSETMAKQYTGTFGAMAKAFGFSESAAYDMGTSLTGLAGDVASFYNLSQDEAYTKLKSVFTGETETLKDLGVVMTQNALDAYAMANGFGKTTQAMTEAEKVALRYQFVQSQLSAAQGDFARTSDSWANQTRILKLQFDSLKATLGQGFINLFTPVLKVINTLLGKLTTLANAFKSFTELITGKKSSGRSAAPVADVADTAGTAASGLENASGAADNLSDSTNGVGKAAKKAAKEMKSLMGFDQINKLSDQTVDTDSGNASSPGTGSGGSIGGGIGSAVNYGNLAEGETALDKLDNKFTKLFESIKKGVQPTVDALKRLWNEGLAQLGNFAWTALKDFYEHFLVPVGKWVFGEGIPRFIDALNNGLMAIDWGKINDALKRLWDALAPFAINVGEGLLWFWENVLVPLGTWVASEVVPRFLDALTNVIKILNNILEALKPLFQWFWDEVLLPLAQWSGGVLLSFWDKWIDLLGKFSDWCAEHQTAIQNMAIIIGSFFAAFAIVKVAGIIGGIVTALVSFITTGGLAAGAASVLGGAIAFLSSPITIAIAAITAIIAAGVLLYKNWDTVKEKAKQIWTFVQGVFQKFDNFLTSVFTKDWSKNFGLLGNVLNGFLKSISDIWGSIKRVFKGIVDFVAGVFTGDWKRAWNGVKNIFGGIWNMFSGLVKTPINTILGFVNGLLRGVESMVNGIASALNCINIDLPGWLQALTGFSSIGFNLPYWSAPRIPYLAQGGYVKPNTPQLAMIGDNRHQGEVVAPEDKMQEMVNAAVKAAAGAGGITRDEMESIMNSAVLRLAAMMSQLGFYVDSEELAKAVRRGNEKLDYRENPTIQFI